MLIFIFEAYALIITSDFSEYLSLFLDVFDFKYRKHIFRADISLSSKTNAALDMGHKTKRYIFVPKTGVVKPKGIFIYHLFLIENYFLQTFLLGIPSEKWYLLL